MAPEILGYKKYDETADLWSVGAVLYEMSVGKPPFRAQNHIELLKKIEKSKGIKFPDEDPTSSAAKSGGGGSEALPVPSDIKKLIRMLLKQKPVERASFDQFFGSTAVAKSKFPRQKADADSDALPVSSTLSGATSTEGSRNEAEPEQGATWPVRPVTPESHKVIPPEVLDEKAMIPPSKFNFRRTSTLGELGSTPPSNDTATPREP